MEGMSFMAQPPGRPSPTRTSATLRPGLAARWARSWVSTPRTAGPIGVEPAGFLLSTVRTRCTSFAGRPAIATAGTAYPGSSQPVKGKVISTAPLAAHAHAPSRRAGLPDVLAVGAAGRAASDVGAGGAGRAARAVGPPAGWGPDQSAGADADLAGLAIEGAGAHRSRNPCRSCRRALCHPGRTAAPRPAPPTGDPARTPTARSAPPPTCCPCRPCRSSRPRRRPGSSDPAGRSRPGGPPRRRSGWKRRHPRRRSFRRPRPAARRSPHRCHPARHRPVRPRHPPRCRRIPPFPGDDTWAGSQLAARARNRKENHGRDPMTLMNGLLG